MKQYQCCHVAVTHTHTLPSATRATVDAATDGASTKKSMGRQNWISGCSTAEKDLEYLW